MADPGGHALCWRNVLLRRYRSDSYKVVADGGSGNDTVHGAAVDLLTGVLKGGSGFDTCTMAIGTASPELVFHSSCEVTVT